MENLRNLSQRLQALNIKTGIHKCFRQLFRFRFRRTPLSQAPAAFLFPDDKAFFTAGFHVLQPAEDCRIAFFQQRKISEDPPVIHRHNINGAAPAAGPSASAHKGRGMGNMSRVGSLAVQYILIPFFIKPPGIHCQHRRLRCQLSVTRISQLFPVRAVRRDTIVEIGALRPDVCIIQPV